MLRLLDALWDQRTPDRAAQIADQALRLAISTARVDAIDRWWSRVLSVSSDSVSAEIDFGDALSRSPALAQLGIERLRAIIPQMSQFEHDSRRLSETVAQREKRGAAQRRRVLSSLGRALVASGNSTAGLDTLTLAAKTGWDLSVFRAIRAASLSTGDSATAWTMTARLVADPSTTGQTRDSLTATAMSALGTARWAALQDDATRLFARRMLEGSTMQSLPGKPRLRAADGRELSLRDRLGGRVSVLVFWSRYCGWALDDLEALKNVAERLERQGSQLVIVIDDEPGPSAELTAFLKGHHVRVPVLFDVQHSTSKAFNNWGSPHYYVLDEAGRLRFPAVSSATEAMVRAVAVRAK
jgi:peroxiredoxin